MLLSSAPLRTKLGRPRPDHFPDDLAGYAQLPADRLDRLALLEKRPAYLCNRLHDQHPNLDCQKPRKPIWALCAGVPFRCRSPRKRGPFCTPIHSHPVLRWMEATLDGRVERSEAVFEAKFMLPWSFSEEAAAGKYMPQLQHNMWVVAARSAVLSV